MDSVSYVSAIKIDADGLCASQAQYVETSCKMLINKIPQLATRRNVKEMGSWFHKELGGGE